MADPALNDRIKHALLAGGRVFVPGWFVHTPAAGKPAAPDHAGATDHTFTAVAATNLHTCTAHGLAVQDRIRLKNSGGGLPGGEAINTDYYVISDSFDADHFKLSIDLDGTELDVTSAGTGTHSWHYYLTTEEMAEMATFLTEMNSTGLRPDYRMYHMSSRFIAKYQAYYAKPDYVNWWNDDQMTREMQYILRRVDLAFGSDNTVAASSDPAGAGSGPVTAPVAAYDAP